MDQNDKNIPSRTFQRIYGIGWRMAIPLLGRNSRLREGWAQRVMAGEPPTQADLWIQAASVGESFLAWQVLEALGNPFTDRPLRVLVTTNTSQGMGILKKAAETLGDTRKDILVQLRYFPLDHPAMMGKALSRVRPRTAVILETEIWPGFLTACRNQGTEILLLNARMGTKSLAGYLSVPKLFRRLAPDAVMAISEADAARFSALFGADRVTTMPNIKFDRMGASNDIPRSENPLTHMVGDGDFVVFGSVREQEEDRIARMLSGLRSQKPKVTIGLFPRHMDRIDQWIDILERDTHPWVLRSKIDSPVAPGTIILWDTFGELAPAYALAKTAFVGGSLAPLGGQNFLEPLGFGVTPVIGPHWKNFAWIGQGIVESGLVRQAPDWKEALAQLLGIIDAPPDRDSIRQKVENYMQERRGGSKAAARRIALSLNNG